MTTPPETSQRLVDAAAVAVLVGCGVVLGVIGTFLIPQRVLGDTLGVSVVIALVGNLGLGLLGGLGLRRLAGALAAGVGWVVTVGVLTLIAPGGDVVVPGTLATDPDVPRVGNVYLVVGLVAIIAAATLSARFTRRQDGPTPLG